MPKRTLGDARRVLEEDVIPRVSDHWAAEYRRVLGSGEADAKQRASRYVDDLAKEIDKLRDEALRDLSSCRDELEDLAREGKTGRLAADVFTDELHKLHRRQDQAEAMLTEAEKKLEQVESIEGAPLDWYDGLARRIPSMLKEFPW
jgi:chromosome segregation ATPase